MRVVDATRTFIRTGFLRHAMPFGSQTYDNVTRICKLDALTIVSKQFLGLIQTHGPVSQTTV